MNKSYTISIPPNYAYSAPSSDKTSLTDGIYTRGKGNYWTKPTTVGWQSLEVTITIDLGKMESVAAVTFNSVRDIGISFPQNIYVFISSDNKNFSYVGDAADTPDNLPGHTQVKKFILNSIDESARYVALKNSPARLLFICDEIEVLKGKTIAVQ